MVNVSPEVVNKVKNFAKSVGENVLIQKVYLFGSYASGRANEDSDIDILILSDDFKKMAPLEVNSFLFRKAAKIPGDIQPVGYSYEEYLKKKNLFLQEILENSVEIPVQ